MIILKDVDGVLADFVGGLCLELRARGFDRKPEDVKHWDLSLSFSEAEMRAAHDIMCTPSFVHGLDWYEGAREFVRELRLEGEVHAVTAPFRSSASWMYERLCWLSSEIPGERIHFVSGKYKSLVRGDVLVEDHPKTAHDWCEANPQGIAVLIDRPWNSPSAAEWHMHSRMYRVRSYDEALQAIRECA